ncbi:MAG: globin [Acidobacteria bacterium]|nr:globin [Acidobacteriota bacterium]
MGPIFTQPRRRVHNSRVAAENLPEDKVFELIGEDGFRRLIGAFYRQIPHDDVLGPMYPKADMAGAEERLREFLMFRFGGPPSYIEKRGHPRLRARHMPFKVDARASERWVQLMSNALTEAALPAEAEQVLRPFFEHVAKFLINQAEESHA